MWVFLNNAFFSAVQHHERPGTIIVRGRLKGDLERLFPKRKVYETPNRDYRFRIFTTRKELAALMSRKVHDIDYTNFKSSVRHKGRHDTYLDVWSVMHGAQLDEQFPGRRQRLSAPQPHLPLGDFTMEDRYTEDWDGPTHRRPLSR